MYGYLTNLRSNMFEEKLDMKRNPLMPFVFEIKKDFTIKCDSVLECQMLTVDCVPAS